MSVYEVHIECTSDWMNLFIDDNDPAKWVLNKDSSLNFLSSNPRGTVHIGSKKISMGSQGPGDCSLQIQIDTNNPSVSFLSQKGSWGQVKINNGVDSATNTNTGTWTNDKHFKMFFSREALSQEEQVRAKAGLPPRSLFGEDANDLNAVARGPEKRPRRSPQEANRKARQSR